MSHLHIVKRLPGPLQLEQRLQSLAVLTGILSWNLGEPRVWFDCHWRREARRAVIDNYQGDRASVVFSMKGTLLEGSVHDCMFARNGMRGPKLRQGVHHELASFIDRELIPDECLTFNAWWDSRSSKWTSVDPFVAHSNNDDGAEDILSILELSPESFQSWAEENYEQVVDLSVVEHVYFHGRLNEGLVRTLNSSLSLAEFSREAVSIGYPVEPGMVGQNRE